MLAMLPTSVGLLTDRSLSWSGRRLLPHAQAGSLTVCFPLAVEDHRNFLQWLSTTVQEAVQTADEHERLKGVIRELKAGIEDRFALAAVQVGLLSCEVVHLAAGYHCLHHHCLSNCHCPGCCAPAGHIDRVTSAHMA